MNAPLRVSQPPGLSIPIQEIAACVECMVAFNGREERACPKCGSDLGIARLRITAIDAEALKTETASRDVASAPEGHDAGMEVPES